MAVVDKTKNIEDIVFVSFKKKLQKYQVNTSLNK